MVDCPPLESSVVCYWRELGLGKELEAGATPFFGFSKNQRLVAGVSGGTGTIFRSLFWAGGDWLFLFLFVARRR